MQKILFIILICIFCTSCGVKSDPEYKSRNNYDRALRLI